MHTLGDVVTALIILAALIIVPYKLAKAWLWPACKPVLMSRWEMGGVRQNNNEDRPISPATTTPQNSNNGIATPAMDSNELLLRAKAEALAAMVKAGKVGETEGIKIIFGLAPSSSNPRYQAARAALKAELERLSNPYPNMTPEQRRTREALGLEKGGR